eukprot:TRINITY_DN13521_c0_g1_i3.p1 TRINITY_DN13521_c0_g1~~TRINITY_DN13521_c0_g1_i3.p1  ORF type:complete len:1012 (-),score=156.71 TRINITY_DN13521_c0_g1_i3:256-3291(-)
MDRRDSIGYSSQGRRDFRALPDLDLPQDQLQAKIPVGPDSLKHGTLPNGLRYFVRKCKKPQNRAALSLAVDVGSVVEQENERGVAHIVEHLAFNATESYTNHDIVKFLESIGAEFGADQNAYTSADETVYELLVPVDNWDKFVEALQVLGQFAFKIRCAGEDLDKERGPVLEEWRGTKDSVGGRLADAHWRLMFQGCQYANRQPIGTEEVIRGVSAEVVKGFYKRWYHPKNMALVVVGDFQDDQAVVDLIKSTFGVQPSQEHVPVPRFQFPQHSEPRISVFVDREAQASQCYVTFKAERYPLQALEDYLEHLRETLFFLALNNRFFKIGRQDQPPFVAANGQTEGLCKTCNLYAFAAIVFHGHVLPAIEAILIEIARVRLYGFSERELKVARASMLSEVESMYLERDQSHASEIAAEYVRHFLNGEMVVGEEKEAQLCKTLIKLITLDDLKKYADICAIQRSCTIKAVEYRKLCTEEQIIEVVKKVQKMEKDGQIQRWQQDDAPENLMTALPDQGTIESVKDFKDLGVKEMILGNGMKVSYKCTDHLEDQILMEGFAVGGLSEVSERHYRSSESGVLIASELGMYGFKPHILSDIVAGKRADVRVSESAYWRAIKGDQSPDDLETTFQMLYLLFTHEVQLVEKELNQVMKLAKQAIIAQVRDPQYHYGNIISYTNYGHNYFFKPYTLREFAKVRPDVSVKHFNRQFSNPAQFTLCFVGKINEERFLYLVKQYLASIPRPQEPKVQSFGSMTPLKFQFPEKPVVKTVKAFMMEPTGRSQVTFPVEIDTNVGAVEAFWLQSTCKLLETRLLQKLRFEFGEIYSCGVSIFFSVEVPWREGIVKGDVAINFNCGPDAVHRLTQMALEEMSRLQEQLVQPQEIETLKEIEQRQFENSQEENAYWMDMIIGCYQSRRYNRNGELDQVYKYKMQCREQVRQEINSELLLQAYRRLFPYPCVKRYTAITLIPRTSLVEHLVELFQRLSGVGRIYWVFVLGSILIGCGAFLVKWLGVFNY